MNTGDKIRQAFTDGRRQAARERREERLKEINVKTDEIYRENRKARFALENERSKEIDAIYEKYRPLFAEIEKQRQPERDALQREHKEVNDELCEIDARAAERVASIIAEDLANNPLVSEVRGVSDNRVMIFLKPITIKRSLRHTVGTTNGNIDVRFNPNDGRIVKFYLDSEGRTHPHGSCLNTQSYEYALRGDFDGAVYDFAMALSVSEPNH